MVAAVEARWREPDHGIWEIRGPRRHHTHSMVMNWFTIRRALDVEDLALGRKRAPWTSLVNEIANHLLANAWNDRVHAFTAALGADDLDAATLLIGLSGLLPATDPRFVATVEAVDRELRDGPTVYRYRTEDGLPGTEGGWHLCMGWLIESLALIGRADDAEARFREWVETISPIGLMAEQHDPRFGVALGNYPQAYSHLALINTAARLSDP